MLIMHIQNTKRIWTQVSQTTVTCVLSDWMEIRPGMCSELALAFSTWVHIQCKIWTGSVSYFVVWSCSFQLFGLIWCWFYVLPDDGHQSAELQDPTGPYPSSLCSRKHLCQCDPWPPGPARVWQEGRLQVGSDPRRGFGVCVIQFGRMPHSALKLSITYFVIEIVTY